MTCEELHDLIRNWDTGDMSRLGAILERINNKLSEVERNNMKEKAIKALNPPLKEWKQGYRILTHDSPDVLEANVRALIAEGWTPLGGIAVAQSDRTCDGNAHDPTSLTSPTLKPWFALNWKNNLCLDFFSFG